MNTKPRYTVPLAVLPFFVTAATLALGSALTQSGPTAGDPAALETPIAQSAPVQVLPAVLTDGENPIIARKARFALPISGIDSAILADIGRSVGASISGDEEIVITIDRDACRSIGVAVQRAVRERLAPGPSAGPTTSTPPMADHPCVIH